MLLVFLCSKHLFLQNFCVFQSSILRLCFFPISVFCIPPSQTQAPTVSTLRWAVSCHRPEKAGLSPFSALIAKLGACDCDRAPLIWAVVAGSGILLIRPFSRNAATLVSVPGEERSFHRVRVHRL